MNSISIVEFILRAASPGPIESAATIRSIDDIRIPMASKTKPTKPKLTPAPALDGPTGGVSPHGQRRRLLIKAAARKTLERMGYRAMKVTDVAAEADVAVGLFYHYFADLKSLTLEILSDFLESMASIELPEPKDKFDAIYAPTLAWANSFSQNPGLMRCVIQLSDESPEFETIWIRAKSAWARKIAKSIAVELPLPTEGSATSLVLAYALGSLVEGLLMELHVHANPDLRALSRSPQQAAGMLATIWYRAIFLENPPARRVDQAEAGASKVTKPARRGHPAKG